MAVVPHCDIPDSGTFIFKGGAKFGIMEKYLAYQHIAFSVLGSAASITLAIGNIVAANK
jgi:hypothetical protein